MFFRVPSCQISKKQNKQTKQKDLQKMTKFYIKFY